MNITIKKTSDSENCIVNEKKLENLLNIIQSSVDLMNYVIEKYNVKSYDEFTCPYHKKLAIDLKLFN